MSGVALEILPLLLQQIVFASAFGLLALLAIEVFVRLRRDACEPRPMRVPALEQQVVRRLPEMDSNCPRNTGFGTRCNPRAPPVLPLPWPDDPNDRLVT